MKAVKVSFCVFLSLATLSNVFASSEWNDLSSKEEKKYFDNISETLQYDNYDHLDCPTGRMPKYLSFGIKDKSFFKGIDSGDYKLQNKTLSDGRVKFRLSYSSVNFGETYDYFTVSRDGMSLDSMKSVNCSESNIVTFKKRGVLKDVSQTSGQLCKIVVDCK